MSLEKAEIDYKILEDNGWLSVYNDPDTRSFAEDFLKEYKKNLKKQNKKTGKEKNKEKNKENTNFRLRGKKLFLTYPSINGVYKTLENGEIEIEKTIEYSKETRENIKEIVLKQIQNKIKSIENYLIGEELHADGIHFHLHCYLELNIRIDISDPHFFDLEFEDVEGQVIHRHGNYQIGKKKEALKQYIIKDENFISNFFIAVKDGKLLKPEEHLFNICNEEGFKSAEESLYKYYPTLSVKKGTTILKNLSNFNNYRILQNIKEVDTSKVFEIEDFDKIPPDVLQKIRKWIREGLSQGFKVTLVLFGPAGTGKTQLARAILKSLNLNYVEISDIEDFKRLDLSEHKAILVDDVDFTNISRGIKLNILDSRASKTINVKYGSVATIGNIPRIVTVNDITILLEDLPELKRRIHSVFVSKKISSKFDVQINVQNNYYFGDELGISKEKGDEILNKLDLLLKEREKVYDLELVEDKKQLEEMKRKQNAYEIDLFNMRPY